MFIQSYNWNSLSKYDTNPEVIKEEINKFDYIKSKQLHGKNDISKVKEERQTRKNMWNSYYIKSMYKG